MYGKHVYEKEHFVQGKKCKAHFFLRKRTKIGHYNENPMGANEIISLESQKVSWKFSIIWPFKVSLHTPTPWATPHEFV